jgi:hypothetical protein
MQAARITSSTVVRSDGTRGRRASTGMIHHSGHQPRWDTLSPRYWAHFHARHAILTHGELRVKDSNTPTPLLEPIESEVAESPADMRIFGPISWLIWIFSGRVVAELPSGFFISHFRFSSPNH